LAVLVAASSTSAFSNTPAPNTPADALTNANAVIDDAFAAIAASPSAGVLPGIPTNAYAFAPAHTPVTSPSTPAELASAPASAPVEPPRPTIVITVDKATQRMNVMVNGEHRWSWPVSTGTRGYATPRGAFKPILLSRHHRSREWNNAPMPYAIFFTNRGHAIHASDAVWRLGSPASHGCVRLSIANARQLFALVQQHGMSKTSVTITGTERAPAAYAKANVSTPRVQTRPVERAPKAQPKPSARRPVPASQQRVAQQTGSSQARPIQIAPAAR
jgi:lipoprotein-anchoring transpeptidase ErfK/SrfK